MKDKVQTKPSQSATIVQLIVNFVIPIIILTKFSGDSQLGATKSLLLALAFPIGLEAYNVYRRRKFSVASMLAVGGILVTGAIGLLGLSENWLAVRRSVPYLAGGIALLVSMRMNSSLLLLILPAIVDMDKVWKAASKNKTTPQLEGLMSRIGYLLAGLLLALAIISYLLTRVVIHSLTNTAGFNQEYAQLRILSLAVITLPLLVGVTFIFYYLISKLETLTGLTFEEILKKK